MQEICHQSFISGIDSNPVPPIAQLEGSMTGRQWIQKWQLSFYYVYY
jgi:hypothetical protein